MVLALNGRRGRRKWYSKLLKFVILICFRVVIFSYDFIYKYINVVFILSKLL